MDEEMKKSEIMDEDNALPPEEPEKEEMLTGDLPESESMEVTEEPAPEPEEPETTENAGEGVEEATRIFSAVEQPEVKAEAEESVLDGITLACALCDGVISLVGRDGFHGGVRPDNISLREDEILLGKPLEHGVGEFTPQELEYMSPELFWDGSRSSSADVYSIGLVLYSVYNHGLMPFWPVDTEATPNIRASALQRRMNREELSPPVSAGSELSAIILRALAFSPEERWNDAEELKNALCDCAEEQGTAMDIRSVLAGMIRRGTHRNDKPGEITSPFVSNIGDDEELSEAELEEEPIPKVKVRRSAGRLPQVLVYMALAFHENIGLVTNLGELSSENLSPSKRYCFNDEEAPF